MHSPVSPGPTARPRPIRITVALLCVGGALLSSAARADEAIVSVGETIQLTDAEGLTLSGNWARVYPADDGGWELFLTGGDTYNVLHMDPSFQVTTARQRLVTEWPHRLVDHQIARCPDGTWLHVASGNLTRPDDSAWLFRYDADFSPLCSATVAERDPVYSYNDAPLICTGGATATDPMDGTAAHTTAEDLVQAPFQFFDADCTPTHTEPHPTRPSASGSSILRDEEGGYFWQIRTSADDFPVLFQLYGDWMEPLDKSYSIDTLVPEGFTTSWPQSAIAVGDYYIVAHLGHDPGVTYNADKGDVWVQVFTRDIEHVQSVRVTAFGDGEGAQRPWLSWRDDTLVLVYDQDLSPRLVAMDLDTELLGLTEGTEPSDTGAPDETDPDDEGGHDNDEPDEEGGTVGAPGGGGAAPAAESGGAGCATGGGALAGGGFAALGLALVGLGRRRER